MLIKNYFCLIFTVMRLLNSTECNNDSPLDNLTPVNESIILLQRFTKTEDKPFLGMTQTRILVLSNQFQISISVRVEINDTHWTELSKYKRQRLWVTLRRRLYWGCETTEHIPSLCTLSSNMATPTLIIQVSDTSNPLDNQPSFVQCSVCFLKDLGTESINLHSVTHHLETLAFNLQQYLPRQLSNQPSTVYINVTRIDLLQPEDNVDKVFITNISIGNIRKEISNSKVNCKFLCGLGPQCLDKISDICDNRINCIQGEDEDNRLCNAVRKGIISLPTNIRGTSTAIFAHKDTKDNHVISSVNSYLFAMLSVIILLILFILFVCLICRSREIGVSKIGKKKITTTIQNSDTSCSTCTMKSRQNLINVDHNKETMTQLGKIDLKRHCEPVTINELEISYSGVQTYYHNSTEPRRSHQGTRVHRKTTNYSKRQDALETANWLNLFFRVSSEARQKSLAARPPPNVSNNNNINPDNYTLACGYNVSTTKSSCVFPVMI